MIQTADTVALVKKDEKVQSMYTGGEYSELVLGFALLNPTYPLTEYCLDEFVKTREIRV